MIKLTRRTKMLFSTGDLSTSIPLAIVMFFQLYFLTDVAGLRPDLAGWAIGAGRVWDAFNDPLFGLLSDRIRSRWGRRRVLLLFGAVPLGLSFAMMWLVPPLNPLGLTAYYAVAFILFDTVFTAVHVGYNALTPEMTHDYDERSSLNGYRMVFSISGTLGAIILATVLGGYIEDTRLLYAVVGAGLGLASIIPPFVVFAVTRERAASEQPAPLPVRQALTATLTNRPFWLVMGLYLLSWTTASILAANLVYFASYYLRVPEQANYFVLVAQGAAIVFIPLWVWVAQRLDKRRAFLIGTASWVAVLAGLFFVGPDQVGLAYALAALAGSGIATAYVLPWSMVPDIIEYDEIRTGQRREGSYYAFASFFQKLATGGALWAMGLALAATGYVTPTAAGDVPVQPPAAVDAIRFFMAPVPLVLLLLAMAFAWRYPISRERHRALLDELAGREL
ncbi:MAG TPA: glycoside-pentoside-hexuronide (GPH):cation symporter [Anaerolineae bacterium]|nr:glycoside-pentoside-hexuronide (GPH):cation symporter [Anaerolineae bacterium]